MGNLGGLEVVVIMMVALIVLGPKKLPEAARQVGRALTELKRISSGFQREMREAIQDPIVEAEARAEGARVTTRTSPSTSADAAPSDSAPAKRDSASDNTGTATTSEGEAAREAEPAGDGPDTQASTP